MPKLQQKDLVVLAADQNTAAAIKGLLTRDAALSIQSPSADVFVHPGHDSGCWGKCDAFLKPQANNYRFALVVFDRHGCGAETRSAHELASDVEERLGRQGWETRAAGIVFDPELEVCVWSDSPEVDSVLGWSNKQPSLRDWLIRQGLLEKGASKPRDPKAAMERALREVGQSRSSAHFDQIARRVSLGRCTDPAFMKLRDTLKKWFCKD